MIVPWTALPALGLLAGAGTLLDVALDWRLARLGAARWIFRALAGLLVVVLTLLHPLAAAAFLALAALERALRMRDDVELPPRSRAWLVALGLASCVCMLRPAVPVYWDEFVWLSRARVACEGFDALPRAALDPHGAIIPRGYPLLASLANAVLSLGQHHVSTLVGGALGLTVLCLGVFTASCGARALGVLACAPLVWVHARSAYVDLPVGLLGASLVALLTRRDRASRIGACLVACLLVGLKDEGLAHVLGAVGVATLLEARLFEEHPPRKSAHRPAQRAWLPAAAALVPFGTWTAMRALHHVPNDDHAASTLALDSVAPLFRAVLSHALDPLTWGVLPPLVCLAVGLAAWREDRQARAAALTLCATALMLFGALVVGPEQVRTFALDGTLLNRLGVQLAPLGAWLLVRVVRRA